ncbi:MAG: EamA family transporter [Myxococcales bacterium]|nr:EamA family transporter [Myxococcales bacterium]
MAAPNRWLTGVLVALLCAIWGSTWLVIRGGLHDLPPFTSAAARFWLAAALMSVVARPLARREGGARPRAWLWLASGLLNFGTSYGIVYFCETRLPSGLVAVLWGVFPILMALSAHWFLPSERLRSGTWMGILLGFAGLFVLFQNDVRALGAGATSAALLLFVSPVVSVVGTTVIKKYGAGTSSVLTNRNAMFVGAAVLSGLALTLERDASPRWTAAAVGSVVYLAVAGTAVTFGVYFWLLRYADAHKLGLIAYVTPAIALTLGWSVGGEPLRSSTLIGTGLVLLAVVLVVRPARKRTGRTV